MAKKGLKDFDQNLKRAGTVIGQLLARSQAKIEEKGRQAIKSTSKLIETMTGKSGQTIDPGGRKVHQAVGTIEAEQASSMMALKSIRNKSISDSLHLLADDILAHLEEHGKISVTELVVVMEKRRRNQGMIFGAIGWLAGEGKIQVTKNGKNISIP